MLSFCAKLSASACFNVYDCRWVDILNYNKDTKRFRYSHISLIKIRYKANN